jgi:hypothetical protein
MGGTRRHVAPHSPGRTRIPRFSSSSEAIRSSPQLRFALAISAINRCRSAGTRGRSQDVDFHRQNNWKPFRCHRMSEAGFTTVRRLRQSINCDVTTSASRVALSARRGFTCRSMYRAGAQRQLNLPPAKVVTPHMVAKWYAIHSFGRRDRLLRFGPDGIFAEHKSARLPVAREDTSRRFLARWAGEGEPRTSPRLQRREGRRKASTRACMSLVSAEAHKRQRARLGISGGHTAVGSGSAGS